MFYLGLIMKSIISGRKGPDNVIQKVTFSGAFRPQNPFSYEFRLEIPQPIKNLRPLNPESTIYRTPTSVSASEVPKCRPASKCQVSKSRPCCNTYSLRYLGDIDLQFSSFNAHKLTMGFCIKSSTAWNRVRTVYPITT